MSNTNDSNGNTVTTKHGATYTTTKRGTVRFLKTGVNGSGEKTWAVQSATKDRPNHWMTETFTTEAEALNWMKWA